MNDQNLWNQLLIWPILNIMIGFYKFFESLGSPGPLGFAIISLTVLMRLVLWPLMHAQMVSAKKMQKLKPKIDELNKQFKDDKPALQKAQLALYQEHGVNPAAGCLPLVIQFPVLIAIYNVFNMLLAGSNTNELMASINKVLYFPWLTLTKFDMSFFGFDLLTKPSEFQTKGWWLIAVPVVTAGLQYYQTKLMMQSQSADAGQATQKNPQFTGKKAKSKSTELTTTENAPKSEKSQEDMMGDMQKQMAIISPLMFGYFAFQFSVGLALYWNVFSLFGIIHQRRVNTQHG